MQKHNDKLSWAILISILVISSYIAFNLAELRKDVLANSTQKISVTDLIQFDNMCNQFVKQWKGAEYIVYLYQPNSIKKTHKELLSTSVLDNRLPLKLEFVESGMLDKNNVVFVETKTLHFDNVFINDSNKYCAVIPISTYNVVNAEIYVFFDSVKTDEDLRKYLAESQVLSKMLR